MNQTYLDLYQTLHKGGRPSLSFSGLWLAHGDEPIMSQWLVDSLRAVWQNNEQNVQRIELVSAKTWGDVLAELDSLSLFSPANAIIVTGNHKPDKAMIRLLDDFAQRIQDEQAHNPNHIHSHLLWITKKQDKRSLSAKWIQPFNKYGLVVDCNLYNERQRQSLLEYHACQFGLNLEFEAWQLLLSHTQNHLLSGYQTLWRLHYLVLDQQTSQPVPINNEQLQSALVSHSSYSTFDLSDAMLGGNIEQVARIVEVLQTTHEPPSLVLWTISKDMRLIQQLHSGKDPQSLGIWRSKQGLYQQAQRRVTIEDTEHWSSLLFRCDQAIKGVIKQPVWELLLQSALAVAGITLFH